MAEPVQYTVQQLKDELASLYMEVKARARREDDLTLALQTARQRIVQLESELEKAAKPKPRKGGKKSPTT